MTDGISEINPAAGFRSIGWSSKRAYIAAGSMDKYNGIGILESLPIPSVKNIKNEISKGSQ